MNRIWIVVLLGAVVIALVLIFQPQANAATLTNQPGINTGVGGAPGAPGGVSTLTQANATASIASAVGSFASGLTSALTGALQTLQAGGIGGSSAAQIAAVTPLNTPSNGAVYGPPSVEQTANAATVSGAQLDAVNAAVLGGSSGTSGIDLSTLNLTGEPSAPGITASDPSYNVTLSYDATQADGLDDPSYTDDTLSD